MIFFRHGQHRYLRILAGVTGLLSLLLFAGLGLGVKKDKNSDSADEQCILCHVSMWNAAINLPTQHLPFLDRQCTACHLATTSSALPASPAAAVPATLFTGTAVSQEPQWTKRLVFKGSAGLSGEQRVVLAGLQADVRYCLRVVSGAPAAKTGQTHPAALWLGLLPQEVFDAGQINVQTLAFSKGEDAGEVIVVWPGATGLRERVEVEAFSGSGVEPAAGLAQTAAAAPAARGAAEVGHPALRGHEEIAIDFCYTCHPQSSLGTSHPVRIYAHGEDIIIPEELPTVDGMLTCVTCHDPHAAVGKKLVREKVATKLCVACHVNFAGSSTSTIF